MSKQKEPVEFEKVMHYCLTFVVILGVFSTLLICLVFTRFNTIVERNRSLEHFHVHSLMLGSELSEHISRLQPALQLRSPYDPLGRQASIDMDSIHQALTAIEHAQEKYGPPEYLGLVQRAGIRHQRLLQSIENPSAQPNTLQNHLKSFELAIKQLSQSHAIAMQSTSVTRSNLLKQQIWPFVLSILIIMVFTTLLVLWLLHLVQARMRQQLDTERRLKEEQQRLMHGQKIQALGTLVGGVAHDFNNILTVILGNAELLQSETTPGDFADGSVMEILGAGERGSDLTRQLLAFSRYELIERGLTHVNQSLEDVAPLLRRLMREDISFEVDLGPDVGMARLDKIQLEQMLMNLVTNAVDAMPDGGTLKVTTAAITLTPDRASIQGMEPGLYTHIVVEDSGAGILPDDQLRVFEPFFTTKERGDGTGLGLSTVHGIIVGSGGHIRVESEIGRGTRFDIYLPLESGDSEESNESSASIETLSGTETILLVEDDAQLNLLTAKHLRRLGYTVLTCGTGDEALQVFRDSPDTIQLILTDVILPGLRGPEFVERARSLQPDIKVIYISGYSDKQLLEKVHASGDLLIPKPFKYDELSNAIRQRLDRARERNISLS